MKILILGATSRIATEVARIYASTMKAEFTLVGRNEGQLSLLTSDLTARGGKNIRTFNADLNNLSNHVKLIDEIWKSKEAVFDLVLVAHGHLGNQDFAEKDQNELQKILLTNYVSPVSLLTLVAEQMKLQQLGIISVITSAGADRGKQSNVLYASAKAGLSVFTDGLRNRLFHHKIHVINLKLGFVDTPMTVDFKKGLLWSSPQVIAQLIVKAIKVKKDTAYLPMRWFFIMLAIRSIPEFFFKRLRL